VYFQALKHTEQDETDESVSPSKVSDDDESQAAVTDHTVCDGDRLDPGDSDGPLLSAGSGNVVNGDADATGDESDSNHGTDSEVEQRDLKHVTSGEVVYRRLCDREVS